MVKVVRFRRCFGFSTVTASSLTSLDGTASADESHSTLLGGDRCSEVRLISSSPPSLKSFSRCAFLSADKMQPKRYCTIKPMSHGAQTFSASAQTPCCYYDAALFYVQSSFFFLYHFLSKIRVRSLLLRGNKKRN